MTLETDSLSPPPRALPPPSARGEDFHFEVHLSAGVCAQTLLLTIKDKDNMGKNETMGTVSIAIQDIISVGSCTGHRYEILDKQGAQVVGKSGRGATLSLDLSYTPT